jgi:hypothetical protein
MRRQDTIGGEAQPGTPLGEGDSWRATGRPVVVGLVGLLVIDGLEQDQRAALIKVVAGAIGAVGIVAVVRRFVDGPRRGVLRCARPVCTGSRIVPTLCLPVPSIVLCK